MYTIVTKTQTFKAAGIIPADMCAHAYLYCNDEKTIMPISLAIPNTSIISVTDETGKDYTSYIKD
jgi:hypothetical protein